MIPRISKNTPVSAPAIVAELAGLLLPMEPGAVGGGLIVAVVVAVVTVVVAVAVAVVTVAVAVAVAV